MTTDNLILGSMTAGERSTTFSIPRRGAATKTLGIVGKKGSGKTWTAAVWIEQLLKAKIPVVILDPVGRWWDLGVSLDGKGPGFPIAIFGGKRGQVPLTPDIGGAIARYVSTRHVPTVVDLSFESKGTWRRVVADFADELFKVNESPIHVVIEEAPEFIPQRVMGDNAVVFGAVDRLVRLGRNHGIGVTAIGQRIQTINKDTLSQVDALILLRLIDPQGREAAGAWARGKGEDEAVDTMLEQLASLPTGAAYVWSPEWLECFGRVHIGPRETFHYDPEDEQAASQKAAIARAVDTDELQDDFAKFRQAPATSSKNGQTPEKSGKTGLVHIDMHKQLIERKDREIASLQTALEAANAQAVSDDEIEHRISAAVAEAEQPLRQRLAAFEGLLSGFVQQVHPLMDGAIVSDPGVLAVGVAAPQKIAAYVAKQSEYYKSATVTKILLTLQENYLRFNGGMTSAEIATEAGYAPVGRFLSKLRMLVSRHVLVKNADRYLLNPAHLK